jgi:hypothetical protein
MEKFTSGGIDNGARPICDAHAGDDENERLEVEERGKAGRRKAGIEAEGCADAIALSRPLERAVESIVSYHWKDVVMDLEA